MTAVGIAAAGVAAVAVISVADAAVAAVARRAARRRAAPSAGGRGPARPGRDPRAVAGAVAATVVLAVSVGPVAALVAVAGGSAAVAARRRGAGSQAAAADALAEVADAFASALRAGAPPRAALRAAARDAPRGLTADLEDVATAADHGLPLGDALDGWAARSGIDGATLFATAVQVGARTGGDPSRPVRCVADTLRERRALRREVRALASQARASAAVIAAAPVAFAAFAAATDRATGAVLLRTPIGLACLAAGAALDAAGWWWMDRITGSVAPGVRGRS